MPTCWAVGCSNVSGGKNRTLTGEPLPDDVKLSFHMFPFSKPDILHQWLRNLDRKNSFPSKTSVVCSVHFKDECFSVDLFGKLMLSDEEARRRGRKLIPDAVPTEFAPRNTASEKVNRPRKPYHRFMYPRQEAGGSPFIKKTSEDPVPLVHGHVVSPAGHTLSHIGPSNGVKTKQTARKKTCVSRMSQPCSNYTNQAGKASSAALLSDNSNLEWEEYLKKLKQARSMMVSQNRARERTISRSSVQSEAGGTIQEKGVNSSSEGGWKTPENEMDSLGSDVSDEISDLDCLDAEFSPGKGHDLLSEVDSNTLDKYEPLTSQFRVTFPNKSNHFASEIGLRLPEKMGVSTSSAQIKMAEKSNSFATQTGIRIPQKSSNFVLGPGIGMPVKYTTGVRMSENSLNPAMRMSPNPGPPSIGGCIASKVENRLTDRSVVRRCITDKFRDLVSKRTSVFLEKEFDFPDTCSDLSEDDSELDDEELMNKTVDIAFSDKTPVKNSIFTAHGASHNNSDSSNFQKKIPKKNIDLLAERLMNKLPKNCVSSTNEICSKKPDVSIKPPTNTGNFVSKDGSNIPQKHGDLPSGIATKIPQKTEDLALTLTQQSADLAEMAARMSKNSEELASEETIGMSETLPQKCSSLLTSAKPIFVFNKEKPLTEPLIDSNGSINSNIQQTSVPGDTMVVNKSCLEQLLRFCKECGARVISSSYFSTGPIVSWEISCQSGHSYVWNTQPLE